MSGMITARWLGPDDRGVLAIISSIPATIWILVNLGTNQASIYYLNRKIYSLKSIVANCFIIPMVLGFIIILFIWFFQDVFVLRYLPLLNSYYLAVGLVGVPFLILQDSFVGVLRSLEKFNLINFRQALRTIGGLCIVISCLVFFRGKLGILILILLALDILVSIWMIIEVLRISLVYFKSVSCRVIEDLFKFGAKSYLQNFIGYMHNRVDMYMIAYFLRPSQVAFYDIAVIIGELLLFLPHSITLVILPKLVRDANKKNDESHITVLRISFLLTVFLSVCLLCVGYWLILFVYGSDYLPAFTLLVLLIPGLIFSSLNGITIPFFTSRNKQSVTIMCSLFSLALNICLNIVFIPKYGAVGAAGVTTVTYSMFSLTLLIMYKKLCPFSYTELFFPTKQDIAEIYNFLITGLIKINHIMGKKG